MEMHEEIYSYICKGGNWHHIDEAITQLEKGDDFDEVIDKTTDNIINEYFDYLRTSNYKKIRDNIIVHIENVMIDRLCDTFLIHLQNFKNKS